MIGLRPELQVAVLDLLFATELPSFHLVPVDALVEGVDEQNPVCMVALWLPAPFEVVSSRVVGAGKLDAIERWSAISTPYAPQFARGYYLLGARQSCGDTGSPSVNTLRCSPLANASMS